jgi:hypothetical protein
MKLVTEFYEKKQAISEPADTFVARKTPQITEEKFNVILSRVLMRDGQSFPQMTWYHQRRSSVCRPHGTTSDHTNHQIKFKNETRN